MTYKKELLVHCAAFLFDVDMANALTAGCIAEDMDAMFCQREPPKSENLPDWKQAATKLATSWVYMQSLGKSKH